MAITPSARSGWYPDPTVPGKKRYWDGKAWTERTIPVTPPAPAVHSGAAADATPSAAPPTPQKPPITTGVIVAGTVIGELGGL
jgi:hypothetical protein